VTPVAIASPAAAPVPQPAAPQDTAPPGGLFATLLAALAGGPAVENADPSAHPRGETGAAVVALLQNAGRDTPVTQPGNADRPAAPPMDDTPPDAGASAAAAPAPLATAILPQPEAGPGFAAAMAPVTGSPSVPPVSVAPPEPIQPSPRPRDADVSVQPGTPQAAPDRSPASPAARPTADGTVTGEPIPTPQFAPSQQSIGGDGAVPLQAEIPSQTLPATAPPTGLVPGEAVPPQAVALPPAAPEARTRTSHPAMPGASVAGLPPVPEDDAASDARPQGQAAPHAKQIAPGANDVRPAAGDPRPAPIPVAAAGSSGSASLFAVAPAADAFLPLPAPDAASQVKTVPLSGLGALSQATAVTAIAAVVASEAAAGTNRFLIRLDPPELGRIDVRLRFGRDGEVHARLVADRPETASLLLRDAGMLERALNASGLRTSESGIDVMLRDPSGGFAHSEGGFDGDTPAPTQYRLSAAGDSAPEPMPVWIRPAAADRLDLTV
jgi:flagellar hook-length control protein FliK